MRKSIFILMFFVVSLYANETIYNSIVSGTNVLLPQITTTILLTNYNDFLQLGKQIGNDLTLNQTFKNSLIDIAFNDRQDKPYGYYYFYGERVLLYNGMVTVNVHNAVNTAQQALMKPNSAKFRVNNGWLFVLYETYANANPYNDAPGLRIGYSVISNTLLRLPVYGNNGNIGALLVVWNEPIASYQYFGTNYTAYYASVIRYEGTNYSTIARGAAGFGFLSNNVAHIFVTTNGVSNVGLTQFFNLGSGGQLKRPWWIYYKGRDFVGFRGQNTNSFSNSNLINYMSQ